MKVLFLDIDGVLNSTRTAIACGGYPHDFSDRAMLMFDPVALGLVRGLCKAGDIKVVVSSAWRIGRAHQEIGRALDLPTVGKTPSLLGCRGDEIVRWLADHVEVTHYAIVDDDPDMLPAQTPYFVKTDGHEGLTYDAFRKLCSLFGVNPYDTKPDRNRVASAAKLDWSEGEVAQEGKVS